MPLNFQNRKKLMRHYEDHKNEFGGFATPEEYLKAANKFLTPPLEPPAKECESAEGTKDIIRYNLTTCEYGILDSERTYIVTYFSLAHRSPASRNDYIRGKCKP